MRAEVQRIPISAKEEAELVLSGRLGFSRATDYKHSIQLFKQLRQAVELDPAMADAHYRLGQAYQQTGQRALAAQELDIFKRLKEQHDNR